MQTTPPRWEEETVEEKVLERKLVKKGNRPATMVLGKWKDGAPEEASWELCEELIRKFPNFHP